MLELGSDAKRLVCSLFSDGENSTVRVKMESPFFRRYCAAFLELQDRGFVTTLLPDKTAFIEFRGTAKAGEVVAAGQHEIIDEPELLRFIDDRAKATM